jgi:CTD small phosphatase-like protein 2
MNKSFYTKRDNDIKLFSKLPTLDNDSQSNSSSSSEDDYPKLIFDKRSSLKKHNKKRRHSLNKKVSFNSNKIVIDNQGKEKKQKTKFSTFQTKNIKSKMKSLELFEQNFDILIDEIEKDYKRKKRSKTAKISKKIPMNSEEKIISLTNMEMISDFYEYTENCMRLITELESKEKQKNKIPPRDFIFEDNLERKKIAIFDLDETLIHCVGDIRTKKNEEYQQKITVTMPTKTQVQIGINIRPHWKKSIREIKKKYYIVVYTASHNNYADAVLDFLDPENCIFEGRLYRKDCIQAQIDETKFYVKDLNIFKNFNLKDIVIIDNSVLSFAYHLNNGIPIVPYYNSKEDSELIILSKYLLFIADCYDLRKCNIEHICMESFLLQAQREKIEDSFKSDEENDSEKEKNNTNKENENKEDIKINEYKLREKTERKKTSNNKRDNLSMRRSKNPKLKTSVIKKRLSILSNNKNEYILDFNDENKNIAPKNFKRRNKTIRYKVQTMMNQIREKFENKIIFDK